MSNTKPWVVIAVDDLKPFIADRVLNALRTAALGTGQADPFEEHMQPIATRIRAEISRFQQISETEYSIPPSLKQIACLMIIEAMQGRLPGINFTEQQREMLRDGRRLLERINQGTVQVERPEDADTDPEMQVQSAVVVVNSTTRKATRDTLAGL